MLYYKVQVDYLDGTSDIVTVPYYEEDEEEKMNNNLNIMPKTPPYNFHYEYDLELDNFSIIDTNEKVYLFTKYSLIKSVKVVQ